MPSSPRQKSSSRDAPTRSHGSGRGRSAEKPSQVPAKGWRDVLKRTKDQINEDNLSIVAAGVAFFAFVAIVPAMAALVAIYALVSDPGQITGHLNTLQRFVPEQAMPLLEEQLTRMATDSGSAGWGALFGILVALGSSMKGTKALITGLNIAYDEEEKRGLIKLNVMAFLLTITGVVGVACLVGLVAILPTILDVIRVPESLATALNWLRWPVLALLFVVGLAALYRFAPSRDEPQWRWASPGAIVGAIVWLLGSALFSLYATSFGNFDATYGSLGAVVVFLMWLYLSAFVILLGGEINCELERQTMKDTTDGPPEPMGQRGAHGADTVGPSPA